MVNFLRNALAQPRDSCEVFPAASMPYRRLAFAPVRQAFLKSCRRCLLLVNANGCCGERHHLGMFELRGIRPYRHPSFNSRSNDREGRLECVVSRGAGRQGLNLCTTPDGHFPLRARNFDVKNFTSRDRRSLLVCNDLVSVQIARTRAVR